MKDNKIVFIIGNGFDLDLGWKTQFSQFAQSSYWPTKLAVNSNLYHTLVTNRTQCRWFDIEQLMANYAAPKNGLTSSSRASVDQVFFDQLSEALMSYLNEQQSSEIQKDSTAAKVLAAILAVHHKTKIYSFNYTDLHAIAGKLGITYDFAYEHVHGDLKNASAIIGIPDSADVVTNYEFLYKTFSPHYSSHDILFDLLEADEVIFFGHSLGRIDYHYFQRFFQQQCRSDMQRKDGKKITIFTYDNAARISILKQLRNMNDKRTDLLYNQNELNVFMTDGSDTEKINAFLTTFSKRLRRSYIAAAMNVVTV